MNTKSNTKIVICFGDSNTWGYIPASGHRFPVDKRWPGILQNLLGDHFKIVEDGVTGRVVAAQDKKHPERQALPYLNALVQAHKPFEYLVIMLGTNDFKTKFETTLEEVASGLADLVKVAQEQGRHLDKTPQIILVVPPLINENAPGIPEMFKDGEKSKALVDLYKRIAEEEGCLYLDVSSEAKTSTNDGCHIDENAHQVIADLVANIIK